MAIGPAVGINGGGTNHLAPSNPEQDKQFLEAMVKQLVESGESLQTIPKQLREQLFAVAKQAGVSQNN
ncbi:hypothetical protein CS022_04485 [Veronia nyctiphanis]|uniref:Uncharacterized protein n=1 Tax=Veronia nyctiphanis TaxID=1278244 RepID=A0A4Q0YU76_9GAMM|nr:hypothetical protein [Veronia nyctiphanis]RXJ74313.1 hypothetical protein CS022_04485 [Veronia nyctiphanis]